MKRINSTDVQNKIKYAREITTEFLNNNTFDPLDVLKGGTGYPDADPESLRLYNSASSFLDGILTVYAQFDKVISLGREANYYV